jgi:hypothetical protein
MLEKISKPIGGPRCADLGMMRLHPALIVAARNYSFAFLLIRMAAP